jgi:predicted metal-binding membrane protein
MVVVMSDAGLIERALHRQRLIVGASLIVLVALSWLYLWHGAGTGMNLFAMTTWQFPPPVPPLAGPAEWSPGYAAIMLAMWWVMMIAMMVPSAAPMILLYARVAARAAARGQSLAVFGGTSVFLCGYLAAWLGFSVLATLAQYVLEVSGALDGMRMWSTSRTLSAALLVVAGIYQLTPVKSACLEHCRTPVGYLASHFLPGNLGAWRMGIEHGAYCVGCCWALMLLLFVGGTMNLIWIAGLAILVLLEKLLARGKWLERFVGLILVAAGVWIYASA